MNRNESTTVRDEPLPPLVHAEARKTRSNLCRLFTAQITPKSISIDDHKPAFQQYLRALRVRPPSPWMTSRGDCRCGAHDRALIKADLVDCMVALPDQIFYSTQIPVCLWLRGKNNTLDSANNARLFDGEKELSLLA